MGGSARVRLRGGGEVVGRPLPGIELGRAVAGIDRTAVPSLGTWLRWAHGLRRFAELGLDELTLAGLDKWGARVVSMRVTQRHAIYF